MCQRWHVRIPAFPRADRNFDATIWREPITKLDPQPSSKIGKYSLRRDLVGSTPAPAGIWCCYCIKSPVAFSIAAFEDLIHAPDPSLVKGNFFPLPIIARGRIEQGPPYTCIFFLRFAAGFIMHTSWRVWWCFDGGKAVEYWIYYLARYGCKPKCGLRAPRKDTRRALEKVAMQ